MRKDLTPNQRRFVMLSLFGFLAVLLISIMAVVWLAPHFRKPAVPVLAEPVDYRLLNSIIEKTETENLERYHWNQDGTAQVPIDRALKFLTEHPESLRP